MRPGISFVDHHLQLLNIINNAHSGQPECKLDEYSFLCSQNGSYGNRTNKPGKRSIKHFIQLTIHWDKSTLNTRGTSDITNRPRIILVHKPIYVRDLTNEDNTSYNDNERTQHSRSQVDERWSSSRWTQHLLATAQALLERTRMLQLHLDYLLPRLGWLHTLYFSHL
jgi:hypothetical protein